MDASKDDKEAKAAVPGAPPPLAVPPGGQVGHQSERRSAKRISVLSAPDKLLEPGKSFGITLYELKVLMGNYGRRSVKALYELGGIEVLCARLRTDSAEGLKDTEQLLKLRKEFFGSNQLPTEEPIPFRVFLLEAMKDYVLYMLTFVAALSMVTFIIKSSMGHAGHEWVDGLAIFFCVVATSLTNAVNDYSRHRKFRSLKTRLVHDKEFSVVRNDSAQQIPVEEILVGDVCLLKAGDRIPADGVLIQGTHLTIDESAMTGISDSVKKDERRDVFLLSGTHVMNGIGRMVVTGVGVNSQAGIHLLAEWHEENIFRRHVDATSLAHQSSTVSDHMFPAERPMNENLDHDSYLQKKLSLVAVKISYVATALAVVVTLILILRFTATQYSFNDDRFEVVSFLGYTMHFIFIGVSILLVAIPEGLPMSIAIGLTYTVKQMLKDNCLVRHINACEKMGNATSICCDKTGVLTTNRMAVVQAFISQVPWRTIPQFELLPKTVGELIVESIAYNCSYISNVIPSDRIGALPSYVGNRTECALLRFSLNLGQDYHSLRKKIPEEDLVHVYPFDSERKMMSTVIQTERGYRVFTKGATEVILAKCSRFHAEDSAVKPMTEKDLKSFLYKVNNPMANDGLRTIAIAYRDFRDKYECWEDEKEVVKDMILLCILGIEDPIRPEAPVAIRQCQEAGVTVRMLTGDNIHTAHAIAVKCGILEKDDNHLVLDSKTFNKRIRGEQGVIDQRLMDKIWPNLRVLARCSSKDKYTLVKGILESNFNNKSEVVAVIGRETRDALVLKRSDIGFGLNMTGTDVTKESCDIILLDDSFGSILKALLWGRNLYDNFCKFLQFQAIISLTAVTLTVACAFTFNNSPFATIQLVYINVSMNLIASMVLATENPNEAIIYRPPYGRNYPIITKKLLVNILGHSMYQMCILFVLVYYGERIFKVPSGRQDSAGDIIPTQHFTIVFNVFALFNLFNLLNCTKINNQRNIFKGFLDNHFLVLVWVSLLIVQFLIVQYGHDIFLTKRLNSQQWQWCLAIAASIFVWHQILLTIQYYYREQLREELDYRAPEVVLEQDRGNYPREENRPREMWSNAINEARIKIRIVKMWKKLVDNKDETEDTQVSKV
nr:PREDICTED: plasma membrane calcium-transporting ATPase 2-like [Bemisia tabaci]